MRRRFRSLRESKHFRKGHVPVQDLILRGETCDARLHGGWYAIWSQVQPAPGIVGDGWQCCARLRPEKRGTPGIREQTGWRCHRRRGSMGRREVQGHLPETHALVTLAQRCRDGLVVTGYRRKGRVGYAVGQRPRGRAKQTIAALDLVVEAEKRGIWCQPIQRQAEAT